MNPGRKGAELARQVLAPSRLLGVEQCRRLWEPGAGKVGGQGALIQPEWVRGSVHTGHVVVLQRR
jgi:hypothetical protein